MPRNSSYKERTMATVDSSIEKASRVATSFRKALERSLSSARW